jgi:hypothetical protein
MEELQLTDPVVVPEKVTAKYRVVSVLLNMENGPTSSEPGHIVITLRNEHEELSYYSYTGAAATQMIKTLNTANLSTKSMHKRILEKLSADGFLPGTVTGTPDP